MGLKTPEFITISVDLRTHKSNNHYDHEHYIAV